MRSLTLAPLALALAAALPDQAAAQGLDFPAASPTATVQERVGLTDVTIRYARPSARGRQIYGGLVPFGEVWRTGANAATTLTFSTAVTFGGQDLEAGTYALFTIPGEDEWTIILNGSWQQWGSYAYDASDDVLRVTVEAQELVQPVETFTMGLGHLRTDSAHLTLDWETTRVAVPLAVDIVAQMKPRIEEAMAGDSPERPFFAAAMFYYEHDVDMDKAVAWINEAARQQPDAMWVVYRQGLVLAKAGDAAGARKAALASLELARNTPGELGAEYVRLNEELIARLDKAR